jgi:lysophospholipase L1-like esterase
LDWDAKLTLEFNGDHPSFRELRIEPIHETTIYLAGDSTVVDQDVEPWAAWGQMLPRFFRPGVVVANHAESGETTRSFVTEQRLAKVMSLIQPGDYLFIQFAHNDQKPNAVSLDDYRKAARRFHRTGARPGRHAGARHQHESPHLRCRGEDHQFTRRISRRHARSCRRSSTRL